MATKFFWRFYQNSSYQKFWEFESEKEFWERDGEIWGGGTGGGEELLRNDRFWEADCQMSFVILLPHLSPNKKNVWCVCKKRRLCKTLGRSRISPLNLVPRWQAFHLGSGNRRIGTDIEDLVSVELCHWFIVPVCELSTRSLERRLPSTLP